MVIFDCKTAKQSFDIDFRIKSKSAKYIKEAIKKIMKKIWKMANNCNIIISDNNYNIMIIGDFSAYYNCDAAIPLLDRHLVHVAIDIKSL